MRAIKHHVKLSSKQRTELLALVRKGVHATRVITRARVLLLADEGKSPKEIIETLLISRVTEYNLRRRFQHEGLDVLYDKPRRGKPRKLNGRAEARLTAIACSPAPTGHERWSLRLLADKLVELDIVDSISHKTVGEVLKKTTLSRGKNSSGA
mgnify:CR=1 FL=1